MRDLDTALRRAGRPARAVGAKAYLKSDLDFHGVATPDLVAIVREFEGNHRTLTRAELLSLVRALWKTNNHELRSVGIALLQRHVALLTAADMGLIERLLRAARSWAYVDWLSTKVSAVLVERHPDLKATLRRWATDEDFWIRRASLLSLLPSLRRGEGGDFTLFEALAVPMLDEREFFIQKAIGWVLRDVSHRRPALTARFTRAHGTRLSAVTWREARKYLSDDDRKAVERMRTREGKRQEAKGKR